MRKIGGLVALASAVALLAAPGQLRAQEAADPTLEGRSRVAVEPLLAQYFFDVPNGDYEAIGGVGVRAMVGRGDVARALNTFFSRARVGVFLVYTSGQTESDVSTFHLGGQGEAALFKAPVANGFLDPFISIGLGAMHASVDVEGEGDASTTDFALTPGVGTLIPLFGAIAIRGDIRDAIVFGESTTNNFVFEGGISIGF